MKKLLFLFLFVAWNACQLPVSDFDAAGYIESDEVWVAAQQSGIILDFFVDEGMKLNQGELAVLIDTEAQQLQKEQLISRHSALKQKTVSPNTQIKVVENQLATLQSQLEKLEFEKRRTQKLVEADAAPRKQLDDINAQMIQIQREMQTQRAQIKLYESMAADQNRQILSESEPIQKSADQVQYQIDLGKVMNPIDGTVLTTYAKAGEMALLGKPLYKIANLENVFLKAYVSGDQLSQIQLNQQVRIRIDEGESYKYYPGQITWISDQAEFSPKTIQTKKERANLVYAIKIKVKNDGFLKIGMYAEVLFQTQ
ncbi:MAG: efflux RND transporter periplasmic adaptor subunit [Flavobacteriaceae bacterium]|nr:efflux RND transporter periplasmic adaptor subunit [Flavobacteriaceae bacterium]